MLVQSYLRVEGILEKSSKYPPTHKTAKQKCKVCKKTLGYNTPIVSYSVKEIIYLKCESEYFKGLPNVNGHA